MMFAVLLLAMFADTAPTENAVVIQPVANIFSKASADADVASQAIYSTNITVLEKQPGWAKVRTPDDYAGWMESSAFLAAKPYAQSGRVAQVESLFAAVYRATF